jgi:hypothetical protein
MRFVPYDLSVTATWADALFASVLQRSDQPSAAQVQQAVAAAIREFGDVGCAARVAQAYGEHPETAAARMRWACTAVAGVLAGPPSSQYRPAIFSQDTTSRSPCPGAVRERPRVNAAAGVLA